MWYNVINRIASEVNKNKHILVYIDFWCLIMFYIRKKHVLNHIHVVALFPETCILFFVIFEKYDFEILSPVYFKLHTGFLNCILCELYTF